MEIIAFDGKKFDNVEDCQKYEIKKKKQDKINENDTKKRIIEIDMEITFKFTREIYIENNENIDKNQIEDEPYRFIPSDAVLSDISNCVHYPDEEIEEDINFRDRDNMKISLTNVKLTDYLKKTFPNTEDKLKKYIGQPLDSNKI